MKNIVILGFMGTGKSCVGKLVAKILRLKFIDTDSLIQKKAGKSIPQIFAEDGENTFRKMEKEVIKEVSKMEGCVIATGGGVVLDGENIRLLKKKGILVCLFASADKIKERTKEGGRPLLEEDMEKKIKELLSAREHLYAQFEHKIDTSSLPPQQVAERIVALFDRCRKSG